MEYLKISNNGVLDERLITLMGGTTKSENQQKIGQFGSGLKYSIAWLVRNNVDFRMFLGEKEVPITTKTETIRDQDFQVIYINGQNANMTTLMGKDWKGWMIVREIWSNALDEGGAKKEITHQVTGEENKTTFYIQNVGEIAETTNEWDSYFLYDVEPIWESGNYAVYPPHEELRLYKDGVLIMRREEKEKPLFSYDIKDAEINEMREFKGHVQRELTHCIAKFNREQAEYFLSHVKGSYEATVDYDWYFTDFSEGWREAIGNAKIIDEESYRNLVERGKIKENDNRLTVVPKTLFKKLNQRFAGISAVRTKSDMSSFFEVDCDITQRQIAKGLAILESCGYYVDTDLSFKVGVFGDKRTLAKINTDEKVIMVSGNMAEGSLFDVVSMLVEENEHYKTGMADESREFQQHFIDLYTKQILERNKVEL